MRSTNHCVQGRPYAMSKALRLLILVSFCFGCVSQVQGAIVFVNNDASSGNKTIDRVNINGLNRSTLFVDTAGNVGQRDVVVDNVNGKMYWTSLLQNIIQRSNLDGGGVETVFSDVGLRTHAIELDIANQKLYWTTGSTVGGATELQRGNTDGTGLETIVSGIDKTAIDLELNLSSGHVYYTVPADHSIYRTSLTGNGTAKVMNGTADSANPTGIALDIDNNRMYWGDGFHDEIRFSDLDGNNINTLISTDVPDVIDVEFDAADGALYWSDGMTERIERFVPGQRDIVLSNVKAYGFDVADVVPEPSTLTLAILGLLGLFVHGRKRRNR